MTISTQSSQQTFLGNASQSAFTFQFVGVSTDDLQLSYTNASNVVTVLAPSQYSIVLNAPLTGSIWGIGGTVVYPLSGTAIASGTSLTLERVIPLQQLTSISGQGAFSPEAVEIALDTLCMQIQQVSARTTQFRGTWITNADYNVGDIVQDGSNGNGTGNYYICIVANTSGTWSTDLSAGDWSLSVSATVPSLALPLAVAQGGTGAITAAAAATNLAVVPNSTTVTGTGVAQGGGALSSNQTISVVAALKADQVAATGTTIVVVPAVQQYHPSAAKAWVVFTDSGTATIQTSFNVASVSRTTTGTYSIAFTRAFTTPNYTMHAVNTCDSGIASVTCWSDSNAAQTGTAFIKTFSLSGPTNLANPSKSTISFFGTQ